MERRQSVNSMLREVSSEDRELARRIVGGDPNWVWDLGDEYLIPYCRGICEGYLVWPEGGPLSVKVLYLTIRSSQHRTGVVLTPSSESKWTILAMCFSRGPYDELLRSAEEAGVTIHFEYPKDGCLTGEVDARCAHDVAKKLMILPTDPTSAAAQSQRPQRSDGQQGPGESSR